MQLAAIILSTTVFLMKVTFATGEGWLKIKTLYRNSQQKFQ
jgi:hypothetical protein